MPEVLLTIDTSSLTEVLKILRKAADTTTEVVHLEYLICVDEDSFRFSYNGSPLQNRCG